MNLQNFVDIGLSIKEASLYCFLAEHGLSPISLIAKKVRMNRGTVYVLLHSLLDKKLVNKSVVKKIAYFEAAPVSKIYDFVKRTDAENLKSKKILDNSIPHLRALSRTVRNKPSIQYFDGPDGVKAALEETIKAKELKLKSYLSIEALDKFLGFGFFVDYTERRIASGYELQVIRTREKDKDIIERPNFKRHYGNSKELKRELRYIDDELNFPMSMYLFDDKVLLISSKEESFGLIIVSPEFSLMQKKIYEYLWDLI